MRFLVSKFCRGSGTDNAADLAESPLARAGREKKIANVQEDSAGKCAEGFSKGSMSFLLGQRDGPAGEAARDSISQDGGEYLRQDEATRRRQLALRQHAFFQLRLHIRRGTNLVAMDRCGKTRAADEFLEGRQAPRFTRDGRKRLV